MYRRRVGVVIVMEVGRLPGFDRAPDVQNSEGRVLLTGPRRTLNLECTRETVVWTRSWQNSKTGQDI
jgi:hypothetical protein